MSRKKNHKAATKKTRSKGNSSQSPKVREKLTFPALLVLLTILAFYPLISAGFINYDDPEYVLQNAYVLGKLPWLDAFISFHAGNYHPLTMILLRIEYSLFGAEAGGFHLFSILLHATNAFLVFLLTLRLLAKRYWIALFTALVFLVHPLHVESVAWLSSTKDLLYTLFLVVAFLFWLDFRRHDKNSHYFLSILFFVLAVLSKPSAAILPAILLAYDWLISPKKNIDWRTLPLFFISAVILWLTFQAQTGQALDERSFSIIDNVGASGAAFYKYLLMAIVPAKLSVLHPYQGTYSLIWICSLLLFGFLIWFAFKKDKRMIAFGLLFFLLNLVLVLQFVSVGRALIAERYTYLAYVGLFISIFVLLDARFGLKMTKLVGAVMLIVFCVLSNQRAGVWKSSVSLWSSSIEHYPEDWYHYFARGSAHYEAADLPNAVKDLSQAIRLNGSEARLFALRAAALTNNKEYEKALSDADRALALNPLMEQGLINRGQIYFETGDLERAFIDFKLADSLGSNSAVLMGNLGSVYAEKKQADKAIEYFNRALNIRPESPEIHLNLANVYSEIGDFVKAEQQYLSYVQQGGQRNARYHFFHGLNQKDMGRHQEAIKHFDAAIRISGKFPQFLEQKALCYLKLGQTESAKSHAKEALTMADKLQQRIVLDPELRALLQ